jgi:hypothetical protein
MMAAFCGTVENARSSVAIQSQTATADYID